MNIYLHRIGAAAAAITLAIAGAAAVHAQSSDTDSVTTLGSTVPFNGDVNPYGLALVPRTMGKLVEGRFLVSNFNNAANSQGTGTTIVQMTHSGSRELFAHIDPASVSCPGGIGLTTALVALRSGFVIVGSLPTTDGTAATAKAGCLLVLNSNGKVVETISGHHINGPWDMTAVDGGDVFALFVTNVLNGTVAAGGNLVNEGTVVRLAFKISSTGTLEMFDDSVIASGFPERTDPAALVIGPTGVAFDPQTGNLFVADSLDNRIATVHNALFRIHPSIRGDTLSKGGALNDPLGLFLSGHQLYVTNGNNGNLFQINVTTGHQSDIDHADSSGGPPPGAGALFGLWVWKGGLVYFVDDATNTFNLVQ